MNYSEIVSFIRDVFKQPQGWIPLHAPYFGGNERRYIMDTIDSTFVSSVGSYVNRFEEMMAEITGAQQAVATVNGTTALHLALVVAGVKPGDLVITQSLTFVATANAISHAGATPAFVDVDLDTMGMSPAALRHFLESQSSISGNGLIHQPSGRRISAVVPMHTFGLPCRIDEIAEICREFGLQLIEDAAESLGSYYKGKHTGVFGKIGVFSFNGNKTVTCGGGGALVTNDEEIARKAKHLSTTAKRPHAWEFYHDEVGYNYRMPNLNAALACAQLEQLDAFIDNKRALAKTYQTFFSGIGIQTASELKGARSNYWLNAIITKDIKERNEFLAFTNEHQVMTRPIWVLMNKLPMYDKCPSGDLTNATWLEERVVNLPSSYRPEA